MLNMHMTFTSSAKEKVAAYLVAGVIFLASEKFSREAVAGSD